MTNNFLPITKQDLIQRGWDAPDIILVTGDAYVDHPSYGTALLGRLLEHDGYRVGIIAMPDWRSTADFKKLGKPKLFFGVTAGNLDSMVANYTANRNRRAHDDYAPGGAPGMRPDRATIVYTNRLKEAFPDTPIVIGGIEASMRRLAHYDYWSEQVRRSLLLDSKADILVYGMGEAQMRAIAAALKSGTPAAEVSGIAGTAVARTSIGGLSSYVTIPSYEEVAQDKDKFSRAFLTIYGEMDPVRGKTIVQKHANRYVIQFPPAKPLTTAELDSIYTLPFTRKPHPIYAKEGAMPAFDMIKYSVTSHRGCPGGCHFCSLYLHQGRIVQSRSAGSILTEIKHLASQPGFTGTITDIGGPTANLYASDCAQWQEEGTCRAKKCLMPEKCKNLKLGYDKTLALWRDARKIPGVKHIFIGSGMRYDLLLDPEAESYVQALLTHHVSGLLKVAPEHAVERVLNLMNKPAFSAYEQFAKRFKDTTKKVQKEQYLVHYFISAHPGTTLEDALSLALTLREHHIHPEQIQDFIPLPMTISGCMYYTGKDPFTGRPLHVPSGLRERKLHRALMQYKQPKNKRYVLEALQKLGKMELAKKFFDKIGVANGGISRGREISPARKFHSRNRSLSRHGS